MFEGRAGFLLARPNQAAMARDLASILRLKARNRDDERSRCSGCSRVPLAGELLHELENPRVVCQLCLVRLPESKRATIASQRVRASERPLAVIARAA
jgi:hypothetical protein